MICTQCGAYSEDNTKYCNVCGAPLPKREAAYIPPQDIPHDSDQDDNASSHPWSFVRAPKWPKPSFSFDAVDPEEAPGMNPKEDARPAYRTNDFPTNTPPAQPPVREQGPAPRSSVNRMPRTSVNRFEPEPMNPAHEDSTDFSGDTGAFRPARRSNAPLRNSSYQSNYRGSAYQDGFGRAPSRETIYEDDDQNEYAYPDEFGGSSVSKPYTQEEGRPAPALPVRNQSKRPGSALLQDKPKRGRSKSHGGSFFGRLTKNNLVFFGIAGVLVVLLIVFAIIFVNRNYGGIGNFFNSAVGGNPILKQAEVDLNATNDGRACYAITVHARKDSIIRLSIPSVPNLAPETGTVNSQQIMYLYIYKDLLVLPDPVDAPTASIQAEITVSTPEGEAFPVEIEPFIVDVKPLNLTVSSPAGATAQVGKSRVPVSGTIDFADAVVTVNGQTLTVAPDGTFSGEYELSGTGDHVLTFEARKGGYQIARQTVNINFTQTEAELEIDKTTVRAGNGRDDTSDNTTVKARTTSGATVTLAAPDRVTLDTTTPTVSESGDFSFTATMSEAGHYDIRCTITKDGASTEGVIVVERVPNLADYTSRCFPVSQNYERMKNEPNHTATYQAVGNVIEVLQTDPYVIAKLETRVGPVLFEYHGTAASVGVEDQRTHNVFGDYKGVDEATGLPIVYAYFITKEG